jgi:TolB-like protein/tetratricopeptide (TPR) repeat protein
MIYRFEEYVLDSDRREIYRAGVRLSLEPQVFELLEFLVRTRERLVTKNEVLNKVWSGRIVSDAALDTRLSAARHAIGDSGTEQRLIRTIRSRGYRFVGAVREEAPSGITSNSAGGINHSLLSDFPRIAVLPFANISGDPGLNRLADGIAQSVAAALSKIGWLFVIAPVSSFGSKGCDRGISDVAQELGARYLLRGSICQASDGQRLMVQLADGLVNRQIWGKHYDRESINSFKVQDEICDNVVAAIEPQLYVAENLRINRMSKAALNSWECIVHAISLINNRDRQSVSDAHDVLRRAVAIDQESAQAHSLLSIGTTLRVHMSWADRREVIPPALALARKALALNPDEPWAHAALGYALIWKQPEEAVVPCEYAVALNPKFAVGHYFLALAAAYAGYQDYVFPHADMAERFARQDLLARGYAGAHDNVRATGCFAAEQYSKGVQFGYRAAAYSPNSPTAYRTLVINLVLAGETDKARNALSTLRRAAPELSQKWIAKNAVWSSGATMKRYVDAFRIIGLK